MSMLSGSGARIQVFQRQADAILSQANPVSGTKYTVLDTTKNVRILSITAVVTWATTQPTPIEIHLTIDGNSITHTKSNPVSDTVYHAVSNPELAESLQGMSTTAGDVQSRSFLHEGRSVKVEVEITWATTQPTPLVCRVKYEKIP